MTPTVDQDTCIGCGVCADTCPEVFEIGADGLSHVINADPEPELHDAVRDAADMCPVAAISIEE